MRTQHHAIVLPAALVAVLGACAHHDEPTNAPGNMPMVNAVAGSPPTALGPETRGVETGQASDIARAAVTPNGGEATGLPLDPPSSSLVDMSDGQVLEVTHVANLGEIEQAKLAQSKAKDPVVKDFAAVILKENTAADQKGTAIAKKEVLTMAPSATSTGLENDTKGATSTLSSLAGIDFDRNYLDTQIKEHRAVLDAMDRKLIPNAKDAEVKAYLAEVRPKLAMHLEHAEKLQNELLDK